MKPSTPPKVFGAAILLMVLFVWFRGCNSQEPLERALSLGDTQGAAKILKAHPSLANKPLRFGHMTPVFFATMCGNSKENIDLLITNGADINARSGGFNLTPLQEAVWSAKVGAVNALLAHNPDVNALNPDNQTAMHYAISVYMNDVFSKSSNNAGKEIMESLLAHGANINLGTPILTAASHYANNTDLIEFLLSKGANPE